MSAYAALEDRFARVADVIGALAVLHWDRAVMMPLGGNAARAEQTATLRLIAHEIVGGAETGELLARAVDERLDPWQAANAREMRRAHLYATAVPARLVEALAKACAASEMVWRRARAESDFAALLPHLQEVVALTRERAQALGEALALSPYAALFDQYQPQLAADEALALLEGLAAELPGLLTQVLERQASRPQPLQPVGPFPLDKQRALAERLMALLGFDFAHGRLDVSAHPFCGGTQTDVRVTTRYDEDDFTGCLMAVLHETGHALYNAGLPADWRRQPVGRSLGMAVHESQSLLIEMQVCRSLPFLRAVAPQVADAFGAQPALTAENLYRLATRVERSLIRVDADEVTYPLHVVLRTRLERALVDGALAVADLPQAWREGMAELVGVAPPDDARGVLQDIHWPSGAIGYFPSYTLGALLAAQLFAAARQADPEVTVGIARGDLTPLLAWLRRNVHELGSSRSVPDTIVAATGRPLGAEAFLDHLRERYLA